MSPKKNRAQTSAKMNWHEKGADLCSTYLSKAKSQRGRLLIFSTFGDLILEAGKGPAIDTQSAGTIFAAINTATAGLNQIFKVKTSQLNFGEPGKGFWMEPVLGQWILVGSLTAYKPALLKPILKHLKSAKGMSQAGSSEALDGMTEGSIDAALARSME